MKLIFLMAIVLAACTTEPCRQYNHDDIQEKSCYGSYGAKRGYCDVPLKDIAK